MLYKKLDTKIQNFFVEKDKINLNVPKAKPVLQSLEIILKLTQNKQPIVLLFSLNYTVRKLKTLQNIKCSIW